MKKFILMSSLILSFGSSANCIGEAQVIGKVKEVHKTLTSCKVILTSDSDIRLSEVCPLDGGRLFGEGIEVGLVNGHDCQMQPGDLISGVLVDNGYFIYLE